MKNVGCKYCEKSADLYRIAVPVIEFETSVLYLMRNQAYPGRCILVLREHKSELSELDGETLTVFAAELARAAGVLKKQFGADKINYAVYGDEVPHLHFHLVPKRRGGMSWGKPFELDPQPPRFLGEAEYEAIVRSLRAALAS